MNSNAYVMVFAKAADKSRLLPALHRQPWWMQWHAMALLSIAALVYGSLIPFDFAPGALQEFNWEKFLTGPLWGWQDVKLSVKEWKTDILTNMMLYGSLGLFVRLFFLQRRWWWAAQIIATAFVLLLVSYSVECVQGLLPSRVPSIFDVLANTAGGLFAALLVGPAKFLTKRVVFSIHVGLFSMVSEILLWFHDQRRRYWFTVGCLLTNGLIIAGWWHSMSELPSSDRASENWLPFAREFQSSYDVAFMEIGWTVLGYAALVVLLSLQLLGLPLRHRMMWLTMVVTAVAVGGQLIFGLSNGFDITGPILALAAVAGLLLVAHLWIHTVNLCDRRKVRVPVSIERRRSRAIR